MIASLWDLSPCLKQVSGWVDVCSKIWEEKMGQVDGIVSQRGWFSQLFKVVLFLHF